MNRDRLLVAILTLWTQLLPIAERASKRRDWIADCQADPHPIRQALLMLPGIWAMREPFQVQDRDLVQPARSDRALLGLARLQVFLISMFVGSSALVVALTGAWTPEVIRWLLGASLFLVFSRWLCWHGLDRDLPWVRATRAGSGVLLSVTVLPILVLTLIPGSNPLWNAMGFLWCGTVMTWDAYWGVHRPLRKRGLLSRK